jgi:hypothetical protein
MSGAFPPLSLQLPGILLCYNRCHIRDNVFGKQDRISDFGGKYAGKHFPEYQGEETIPKCLPEKCNVSMWTKLKSQLDFVTCGFY